MLARGGYWTLGQTLYLNSKITSSCHCGSCNKDSRRQAWSAVAYIFGALCQLQNPTKKVSTQGGQIEKAKAYECWHYLGTALQNEIWHAVILQIPICSAMSRSCQHSKPSFKCAPAPAGVCFCSSPLCKQHFLLRGLGNRACKCSTRKWDARIEIVIRCISSAHPMGSCLQSVSRLSWLISWSTTLGWGCSWAARYRDSNCSQSVPSEEVSKYNHFNYCELVDHRDCRLPPLAGLPCWLCLTSYIWRHMDCIHTLWWCFGLLHHRVRWSPYDVIYMKCHT